VVPTHLPDISGRWQNRHTPAYCLPACTLPDNHAGGLPTLPRTTPLPLQCSAPCHYPVLPAYTGPHLRTWTTTLHPPGTMTRFLPKHTANGIASGYRLDVDAGSTPTPPAPFLAGHGRIKALTTTYGCWTHALPDRCGCQHASRYLDGAVYHYAERPHHTCADPWPTTTLPRVLPQTFLQRRWTNTAGRS